MNPWCLFFKILYTLIIKYVCLHTVYWRRQWHPTPILLPGESHGWRSLVGCSPWGREESDMTERLHFHFSLSCIGEGNGNPLQCSFLENPRDGGAWWAAVYRVVQSRTRLKWLSSSSMLFSIVMYGCESGTVKKAEHQRIDAFKLQCWRSLLRVPGEQGDPASQYYRKSTLNTHWKNRCWSFNSLATWCEESPHWKRPWCWKRLKAKGEGGSRGWDG